MGKTEHPRRHAPLLNTSIPEACGTSSMRPAPGVLGVTEAMKESVFSSTVSVTVSRSLRSVFCLRKLGRKRPTRRGDRTGGGRSKSPGP
eukprot:scaffold11275_cov108-Isochrysis_galbana.AAC.2